MSLLTIILFFMYVWGLGFTATSFVKSKPKNNLERHLMNLGIGLGIFPILSILINLLHIHLDWKIFLFLSLIYPVISIGLKIKNNQLGISPSFKLKKSTITILLVLVLFFGTFYMYHKGAFSYPYFEDTDPWSHAVGAKYIALEKTAFDPIRDDLSRTEDLLTYIDPYPPSYDILMGILHQTNDSINWTLKFFNALIISLGIIFFYFFAKQFTKNRNKALFSTFVLAMIPCYLSHFIWAHSLIVTLFFPAMYCLERIKYDSRWAYVSALIIASITVVQPTQALKLNIIFFLYFITKSILQKKFLKNIFFAQLGGILLSLLWWGHMIIKYKGIKGVASAVSFSAAEIVSSEAASSSNSISNFIKLILNFLKPNSGSATRVYTFNDFFIAKGQNMINNPIGVGIIISILLIITLVFLIITYKSLIKEKNHWKIIALVLLIFTFLGVNSMTFHLPIGLGAFRFWMLFAIPLSLIVCEGMWFLMNIFKKYRLISISLLILAIIGIFFTSGIQKYEVNTASWPTDIAASSNSYTAPYDYAEWFNSLPKNTNVFMYSGRQKVAIGFDAFSCEWCPEIKDINQNCILNQSTEEFYKFLKKNRYEYLFVSTMAFKYVGKQCGNERAQNEIPIKLKEFVDSGLFQTAAQKENAFIAFKI